jgi:hypothetical protein
VVLFIQSVRAFYVSLDVKQHKLSECQTNQNQGRLDYESMEEKERTKYTNMHHSQVEGNVEGESHSHKA